MILGQYSPSIYLRFSSVGLATTLVVIYWISQYYGHDQPFPHTSISQVSKHFPEYVLFRMAAISGPVLVVLGWITNLLYLKTIAFQNIFDLHPYHPVIMTAIGIIGSISLMASTALIDTGYQNWKLHQKCAQIFFLLTIIAQLYNTIVFSIIYYKQRAVSRNLMYGKLVLAVILIWQIYLAAKGGDSLAGGSQHSPNSDRGNFLQWTISFTICAGYYLMSLDLSNFQYVYEKFNKVADLESYSNSATSL